jgi:hypothetical protein
VGPESIRQRALRHTPRARRAMVAARAFLRAPFRTPASARRGYQKLPPDGVCENRIWRWRRLTFPAAQHIAGFNAAGMAKTLVLIIHQGRSPYPGSDAFPWLSAMASWVGSTGRGRSLQGPESYVSIRGGSTVAAMVTALDRLYKASARKGGRCRQRGQHFLIE